MTCLAGPSGLPEAPFPSPHSLSLATHQPAITAFLSVAFSGVSPLPQVKSPCVPAPQRILTVVSHPRPRLSIPPSLHTSACPSNYAYLSRHPVTHRPIHAPTHLALHSLIVPP